MWQPSRMTSAVSVAVVLRLFLARYTSDQTSGCGIGRMPLRRGKEFKRTLLGNTVPPNPLTLLTRAANCEVWHQIQVGPVLRQG